SRVPIAGWRQTLPRARAIAAFRRRFAPDESTWSALTLRTAHRRFRRLARWFARSRRRDGRSRFTEPANHVLHRSTSHVAWPRRSIRGRTDVTPQCQSAVVWIGARHTGNT